MCTRFISRVAVLLAMASSATVHAVTLHVNCSKNEGLNTIGAALKILQGSEAGAPATIFVSGHCRENVVIQSMDRLTLSAAPGASITDPSGGNLDVIDILDSRDVSINNFTINGGPSGVNCLDRSLCRLNGNTIQGASFDGVAAFFSQVDVIGGTLRNNATYGLGIYNGSQARALDVNIQNNGGGIEIRADSFLNTNAVISANSGSGVFATHNATLNCIGCKVSGNGILGLILRRNSTARISGDFAITGNAGGGVLLTEESSAYFPVPGNVTGNTGGLDVACGASATTAKFAKINIGGGSTNCAEPVDP
jgi:Periplasmic copper-binding protein (NosD)